MTSVLNWLIATEICQELSFVCACWVVECERNVHTEKASSSFRWNFMIWWQNSLLFQFKKKWIISKNSRLFRQSQNISLNLIYSLSWTMNQFLKNGFGSAPQFTLSHIYWCKVKLEHKISPEINANFEMKS